MYYQKSIEQTLNDCQTTKSGLSTQEALSRQEKYGKNAVLRGTNLLDAGTQRERNNMIGGHRAGYDSTGKS